MNTYNPIWDRIEAHFVMAYRDEYLSRHKLHSKLECDADLDRVGTMLENDPVLFNQVMVISIYDPNDEKVHDMLIYK